MDKFITVAAFCKCSPIPEGLQQNGEGWENSSGKLAGRIPLKVGKEEFKCCFSLSLFVAARKLSLLAKGGRLLLQVTQLWMSHSLSD